MYGLSIGKFTFGLDPFYNGQSQDRAYFDSEKMMTDRENMTIAIQ